MRYIAREALAALCSYAWPDNIRELAHAMETAVLMNDSDRLTISDLPGQLRIARLDHDVPLSQSLAIGDSQVDRVTVAPSVPQAGLFDWSECEDSHLLLDNVIKRTLIRSLEQTQGNRRRAADLLGVSRSTLYRMLERYELCDRSRAD